jgi:chromosome segregation ATPase
VILSKAAVVADAESHIKKDQTIANLTVQVTALSNQPQANPQQLVAKQNEIKSLRAENAKKDQQIAQLKRQVANLQNDLKMSEQRESEVLDQYLDEVSRTTTLKDEIAELKQDNATLAALAQKYMPQN